MLDALSVGGICQGADEAACPVEVFRGDIQSYAGEIFRKLCDICIHRQQGIKGGGGEADPLHALQGIGNIASHLADGHDAGAVDADGAVNAADARVVLCIGVIGRSLVVGGEEILHILHGHFPVGYKGPGDIIALRGKFRLRPVPLVGEGGKVASHEPGSRCIVDVVHICAGPEDISGIESIVLVEVEGIVPDKLLKVRRAEICFLRPEGILQVKGVGAELVRVDYHHIIRDAAGNPVMAADGLQPPDLILIADGDAVGFIGSVLLQKRAEAENAFSGASDVGQYQDDDVLLADAAGNILLPSGLCLFIFHQRICRENPRVGGDGLGGGHGHVRLIDAGGGPDSLGFVHARAGSVAHRVFRQRNLHMGENAFIDFRLILRVHHDHLLDIEVPVVRAGDHGRTVVGSLFSDKYGCAGHN